ncbi:DinB family protein [Paractinoplanes rhizophilus]|uniref:DinB family protein n=1 Tax=Paractinoplanes rhizophilus TaxID=1416877 RepID=A0ABW2HW65_9ACTN|nr:DinB family protein [Actinoplanes sp.]
MSDIVIESIARPERKVTGSWLEVIASNLDYHRATFLWKCAGLTAEQLRQRSAPPSELSLLWLMRHLRGVERYWFQRRLAGTTPPATDPASAAEIYADYLAACAESREVFAKVTGDLSRTVPSPEFGDAEVRFVLTHLIEEYARHVGHADLLREAIDGATGE